MKKTVLICDCLGTQPVDGAAIGAACDVQCSKLFTALCTDQLAAAAEAIGKDDVIIACQQEATRFADLAEELDRPVPAFVDLRDRAGWSDQAADVTAKQAALLAEALLPQPQQRTMDVTSEGTCLILGSSDVAQAAADQLSGILAVTVLMSSPDGLTAAAGYDTVVGRLARAAGALGQFEVRIDALQQVIPGGRGTPQLTPPRDDALSECDVILDLSGGTALFPAPEKREGYLRADPGSQPAVAAAILAASQMVGTFEKPLYVRLEEALCAHSRAEQPACSKCLDVCPTGAITSAGEHVAIDPMICAGCGACSALCPSGAITYDAPPVASVFRRIQTLSETYRKAGGDTPRLLVHDAGHGAEMISLCARFGRGLPSDVIPLGVAALSGFGHAEMLAALSAGFAAVDILMSPRTERDTLEGELALAGAMAGKPAVRLLDPAEPDALCDMLYGAEVAPFTGTPSLPIGNRRQVARLAAKTLQPEAAQIDLPAGAPYGAVLVDNDACTLCLSCVSLCPSGALGDNPDLPQLRFQEDACLQCGLCANICPENAITLKPQMDLTDAALRQKVVHEEEPFACIECGNLFGVKSTVDRITEKLQGHSMFSNPAALKMIQMCDNCRVQAQYHATDNPFQGKERPKPRTSEDYFAKRKDH